MLCLSRKKNEKIQIGDNITICVVEIFGDKVRLGIEAPTNISVDRSEVREAKMAEEVKRRLAAGEFLSGIERDLDHRENLTRTTNVIPAACVVPEHRQSRSPLVECQENVAEAIREYACEGQGNVVADCCRGGITRGQCKANAAFIVRACNAHYQLLSMCEAALPLIEAGIDYIGCSSRDPYETLANAMRATIAKAADNTGAEMSRLESAVAERAGEP